MSEFKENATKVVKLLEVAGVTQTTLEAAASLMPMLSEWSEFKPSRNYKRRR
jgi:hypothetical protein